MDKKHLCHVYYTMNLIRDFENQSLKFLRKTCSEARFTFA